MSARDWKYESPSKRGLVVSRMLLMPRTMRRFRDRAFARQEAAYAWVAEHSRRQAMADPEWFDMPVSTAHRSA